MLNQVQHKVQKHDIRKEPDFRKRHIMSKKIIKPNDIFDALGILDSNDTTLFFRRAKSSSFWRFLSDNIKKSQNICEKRARRMVETGVV